jgi:hypothetical protein
MYSWNIDRFEPSAQMISRFEKCHLWTGLATRTTPGIGQPKGSVEPCYSSSDNCDVGFSWLRQGIFSPLACNQGFECAVAH